MRTAISTERNNRVALMDDFVGVYCEAIEIGHYSTEHSFGYLLWSDIWVAVGVGDVFGFVPNDFGIEHGKHCSGVSASECGVEVTNRLWRLLGHGSSEE